MIWTAANFSPSKVPMVSDVPGVTTFRPATIKSLTPRLKIEEGILAQEIQALSQPKNEKNRSSSRRSTRDFYI